MLLVHDTFVFARFKGKDTHVKEAPIIQGLCLEGIAMKKFMLSRKGKGLKLETIKEVERQEQNHLLQRKAFGCQWKNAKLVNGIDRGSHDRKVGDEPFDAFIVGLLHKSNEDTIVK